MVDLEAQRIRDEVIRAMAEQGEDIESLGLKVPDEAESVSAPIAMPAWERVAETAADSREGEVAEAQLSDEEVERLFLTAVFDDVRAQSADAKLVQPSQWLKAGSYRRISRPKTGRCSCTSTLRIAGLSATRASLRLPRPPFARRPVRWAFPAFCARRRSPSRKALRRRRAQKSHASPSAAPKPQRSSVILSAAPKARSRRIPSGAIAHRMPKPWPILRAFPATISLRSSASTATICTPPSA